jgi:hypothetical protein
MEKVKLDALVGRTDSKGIYRMKNIGTAFVNETNIKIMLDALPMSNANGQAIIYLKESSNVQEANAKE